MVFTYDKVADVLTVRFSASRATSGRLLVPGYVAHMDKRGNVVRLEITEASKRYDMQSLLGPELQRALGDGAEFLGLESASRMTGLEVSWLRRLCQRRKVRALKVGRDWLTTEPWLAEYGDSRRRKTSRRVGGPG